VERRRASGGRAVTRRGAGFAVDISLTMIKGSGAVTPEPLIYRTCVVGGRI
jgi:hypothetical protein